MCGEQCPHSQKSLRACFQCQTLFPHFGLKRKGFCSERTAFDFQIITLTTGFIFFVFDAVFLCLKQNLIQMHFCFKSQVTHLTRSTVSTQHWRGLWLQSSLDWLTRQWQDGKQLQRAVSLPVFVSGGKFGIFCIHLCILIFYPGYLSSCCGL